MDISLFTGLGIGLIAGAALAGLLIRMRHDRERADAIRTIAQLETELTRLTKDQAQRETELTNLKSEFEQVFKALAADTLKANTQSFLELANATMEKHKASASGELERRQQAVENLVKPINESLTKVNLEITQLEKERARAQGQLTQQLKSLDEAQQSLRLETGNLVKALRKPEVRGRWGEMQLQRVVEMAGMLDHVDFLQQESTQTESGQLRPDMVIKLPGGKNIVVDAKCPLQAYLDALESSDEKVQANCLENHSRQVKDHITKLGRKQYWSQFEPTPEFVVLFLPGEHFFSAALAKDPGLIEAAVGESVIIATPTTLISLLKTVAYGWKQETIADSAREISELGRELYNRVSVFTQHFTDVGARLDKATESYNKAVGSLETRVLVQARRFNALGVGKADSLPVANAIPARSRQLNVPELLDDKEKEATD
jgi:DNA recombination protein RmuC